MSGRPRPEGWGIARQGRARREASIWEMVNRLVRGGSGVAVGAHPRDATVMDWLVRRGIRPDRRVTPIWDPREVQGLQYLLLLPGWDHGAVGTYLREVAGPMTRSQLEMREIARYVIGGCGTQIWTEEDVDDVLGFEERRPTHEEMMSWNAAGNGDFRERAERMLKWSGSGATSLRPPLGG